MRHRLHSISPYFAMFPETFVEAQLQRFTTEGDHVFDPFSGRGTTLFESLIRGRRASAVDINPVAYCLTKAKGDAPDLEVIDERIQYLRKSFERAHTDNLKEESSRLPPFFRRAFYHSTLHQLLFLRRRLQWRESSVDTFIAAIVLGSLHGDLDDPVYFSNQMPRTICLKPEYSLSYWRQHKLFPRKRDVFAMLRARAEFRLQHGKPRLRGLAKQEDARNSGAAFPELHGRIRLVVTSPPYLNVTNFEEDQWLRLWFLGGQPYPTYGLISRDDRHENPLRYWTFLTEVWRGLKPLLRPDATMVVRIGTKSMTLEAVSNGLQESLRTVFPSNHWFEPPTVSVIRGKQARAFNPSAAGCTYETDFVYAPFCR